MPAPRTAHRAGRFATGLGALIVLIGLLVGAPIALLAFAGNPLPDQLPTLDQIGTVLTSRDDGQLFLRALALVGWAGWATFALSVLVEVPARVLRRPAVRLPGLGRQQRWAAALVGSVALALAAGPAAATAAVVAAPAAAAAAPPSALPLASPVGSTALLADEPPSGPAPHWMATPPSGPAPHWMATPPSGPAPHWLAAPEPPEQPEPVYRVEKGDYLGHIADRYLGDFDQYPELARLNKIHDPDRIRPGQLLHLPEKAEDRGVRDHATGLVATPPPPGGWPEHVQPEGAQPGTPQPGVPQPGTTQPGTPQPSAPQPEGTQPSGQPGTSRPSDGPASGPLPEQGEPEDSAPARPTAPQSGRGADDRTTYAAGAVSDDVLDEVNRPLAISAVIAVAGMVGAQVGALFGIRGRPPRRGSVPTGRHRHPS
ncbi:LysM peptidoglycan-binding domain-containing protein [Plantactinospora sonchi]|uniref:LysM peptidoglycan-binding domain-containing protein n=1 Tax=Plantactinospora sonchi TaxID=1544735 RepID=A0ABU7RPK7_9ACTN